MADYRQDLPTAAQIRALIETSLEMYQERDRFIANYREAIEGRNPVEAPASMQYKVKTSHTYHLQAISNEKLSRYRRIPEYEWLPFSDSQAEREAGDKLEKAVNLIIDAIDRNSDGQVWEWARADQDNLDAGVIRVERAPAAFWSEIAVLDEKKKNRLMYLCEQTEMDYEKAKDTYLKSAGVPIRMTYVPLERFYPYFDGGTLVESLEFEERTVRSVLQNPLFKGSSALSQYQRGADGGVKQKVVVVHHVNHNWHSYWAVGPSISTGNMWPRITTTAEMSRGTPVLLHSYEHKLGHSQYVYMPGRGSGWKHGFNKIDASSRALLELNQDADQLYSQVLTYIRNILWPTRVAYYDKDKRGADDSPPKAPALKEGEIIAMWIGEEIRNLVENIPEFQLAQWAYQTMQDRMRELAGSVAQFGQNPTGTYAGYHYQAQVTQSQHLDALVESACARGALDLLNIVLHHCRHLGERVYVHAVDKDANGKVSGQYLYIDTTKLEPWPIFGAKVRDSGPMDRVASAQAAIQLTQVRPGHGTPLVSDEYARQEILEIKDPDAMERRIHEEAQIRKLLSGDFMSEIIAQQVGMILAEQGAQQLTPEMAGAAAPSVLSAANGLIQSGATDQQGGVSPMTQSAMLDGGAGAVPPAPQLPTSGGGGALQGLGGGLPAGSPQPMQVGGRIQQILQQVGTGR